MTVLDAFAVIGFFRDEPCADEVQRLLAAGNCQLTAVNVAEVVDRLCRLDGVESSQVEADLAMLGLDPVGVDASLGVAAGRLRSRHYHRTESAVSLADCIAAAWALEAGRALATSDPALLRMVTAEGGLVHELPGSG